jgi:hypothetical protein
VKIVRRDEGGFATIQYVVASAFSLLLFVLIANLFVDLYERGAVRDALDEGVRAGVPAGASPADCETRVREVLHAIAGGSLLRVDSLSCTREGAYVVATARVSLHSWLPMMVPDWHLRLRASALPEQI